MHTLFASVLLLFSIKTVLCLRCVQLSTQTAKQKLFSDDVVNIQGAPM